MIAVAEVRRIAQLARLALSPQEAARMAVDLAAILDHMSVLQGAAEPELVPLVQSETPQRPDLADPDRLVFPVAELSSWSSDGFFSVPRLAALDGSE